MPPRGDCTAPTFDPSKPRELKRFFSELKYHFDTANVTDDTEKKNHATRYVDFDIAEIWESFPSFSDASATYDNFRAAVFELYPAADEEYRYTIADLDFLITDRQRLDITSLADLAAYHAQFLAITNFLISKHRLSQIEQQRAYVRGFPPALWSKVAHRLQLKFIDHYPDDPYPIADVYAAARFVFHSTRSSSLNYSSTAPSPSPSILDSVFNTAQLSTIFAEFTKSIIAAINSTQRRPRAAPLLADTAPRNLECAFCGKGHFIRNCALVEEYRLAGKLKYNVDGKVILPTGAFVPRYIPGRFLKDRIDEWHRRHPGQLAAASISYGPMFNSVSAPCAAPPPLVSTYSCTQTPAEVRITELEAEIARLRSKRPSVTSPINARLQPFRTAAPTIPTRELSPAPRIAHPDRLFAQSSRTAEFVSPEPRFTEPHPISVHEFDPPAPRRPSSVPLAPRAVQKVALASDITSSARPASVHVPSTFPALCSIPGDVYFNSEHAQTALSLSESPTCVVLAPGDQERFRSSPICSAALSKGYSAFIGLSSIVAEPISIPALPLRSGTPPSIIQPLTSLSIATLASGPQKYVASHQESSRTFRTRAETASVTHTHSDSSLVVVPCLADQERVIPPPIRSTAPSINPASYLYHPASICIPILILAPPRRSYALPSIAQPSTFPKAASRTIEPRPQRPPKSECPKHVSTHSPSLSASNASSISIKSLYTATLFVPTSLPLPASSPPRFSLYNTPPRFSRRRSRCATRSVRTKQFYSPLTSSFAAPRSSAHPLLQYTSRRLDASHTRPKFD